MNLPPLPRRGQLSIWHGTDQRYNAGAELGAGGGAWLEHRLSAVSEDPENPASIRQCGEYRRLQTGLEQEEEQQQRSSSNWTGQEQTLSSSCAAAQGSLASSKVEHGKVVWWD